MTDRVQGQLLAEGELNWRKAERVSDRYGAIHIQTGGFYARTLYDLESDLPVEYATFDEAPVGMIGRLLAEVTVTRDSYHIGDSYHEIEPTTPEVGEIIILGEGELFVETDNEERIPSIGVKPDDDREAEWMDIRSLYRAHSQTVKLYFEPDHTVV